MKGVDLNIGIIEGYAQMLDNLSADSKLALISRLTQSVGTDIQDKKTSFKKSFGAFQSKKSADQLIAEIRHSRAVNRDTNDWTT